MTLIVPQAYSPQHILQNKNYFLSPSTPRLSTTIILFIIYGVNKGRIHLTHYYTKHIHCLFNTYILSYTTIHCVFLHTHYTFTQYHYLFKTNLWDQQRGVYLTHFYNITNCTYLISISHTSTSLSFLSSTFIPSCHWC